MAAIIFDEWVATDGGQTEFRDIDLSSVLMSYSINAGSSAGVILSVFGDNFGRSLNSFSANDGYLYFDAGIAVFMDDVFKLKAGTYTLPAGTLPAGFNPQANQTFVGNTFLTNSSGVRLSSDTSLAAVPEPSLPLLLVGGLIPWTIRRRRPVG